MNHLPLSIVGLVLSISPVFADTLYVNNDTAYPADHRTFDDAFAAAATGDTIMLAPSLTSYGTITITGKSIKLLGGGASNKNALLQPQRADVMDSIIDRLYLGYGSSSVPAGEPAPDFSGSNGTTISSVRTTQGVWLWSDDCVFTRCETASSMSIHGDRNIVTGSVIRGGLTTYSTDDPVIRSTGSLVTNCLLTNGGGNVRNDTTATFTHCVIGFLENSMSTPGSSGTYSSLGSTSFRHCILAGSTNTNNSYRSDGTSLHHCIIVGSADSAVIPSHSSANGNITTTDTDSVFDDGFALKTGSPAIGAGEDSEDLGIFGGPTPFQWGGLPAIPLIEKLDILSANPTTGLRFRVKAVARD